MIENSIVRLSYTKCDENSPFFSQKPDHSSSLYVRVPGLDIVFVRVFQSGKEICLRCVTSFFSPTIVYILLFSDRNQ